MSVWNRISSLGAAIWLATAVPALAAGGNPNDAARFLAGLQPPPTSLLTEFTRTQSWERHAKYFDAAWQKLDEQRLSKIRQWSGKYIKDPRSPLFYMFSGPDFLYANAFFPSASIYVLSGLEPVGRIPEINEQTVHALPNLRASIESSLSFSFFITKDMKSDLRETELSGTLPILYAYIARSGKTIRDVSLVSLGKDGVVTPVSASAAPAGVPGAKIVFTDAGRDDQQTLYYFRVDVSDPSFKSSGFQLFSDRIGSGNSLLKSASYLTHQSGFKGVRDFLLQHSKAIVQDDSGIPLQAFNRDDWQFQPFGKYLGPIAKFDGKYYQAGLRDIFAHGAPQPLGFGIGYRWRGYDSNLLLAVRKTPRVEAVVQPPAR